MWPHLQDPATGLYPEIERVTSSFENAKNFPYELTALHSLPYSNDRHCSMHCVCEICNSNEGCIKFTDILSMTPYSLIQVATFLKAFVVLVFPPPQII